MKHINPYRLFVGAVIPNWLLARPEVSPGAKLCYARLAQYAGRQGTAYPAQEALAAALGCSRRQVIRYLGELTRHGLLAERRPGWGRANRYHFLAHPWIFEGEGGEEGSAAGPPPEVTDVSHPEVTNVSHPEVTDVSHPEVTDVSHHNRRESTKRITRRESLPPLPPTGPWERIAPDMNLNELEHAVRAVEAVLEVKRLGRKDQETLCRWLERFDMRREILPALWENLQWYRAKHGTNPGSLAYHTKAIEKRGGSHVGQSRH